MSRIAKFAASGALALAACIGGGAQGAAPASVRIQVEARGSRRDIVVLTDAATHATLVSDGLAEGPVKGSLVAPDGGLVVVRHGAGDDGSCLAAYAIAPAGSAQAGKALAYCTHDGRLDVSLQPVPNGVVLRVRSGHHLPLWHKTFLFERASRRWVEWPRLLGDDEPPDTTPTTVREAPSGADYVARLRPLAPRGD